MQLEEPDHLRGGVWMYSVGDGAIGSLSQGLGLALKRSKALSNGDGNGVRHTRQSNGMSTGVEVGKAVGTEAAGQALNAVFGELSGVLKGHKHVCSYVLLDECVCVCVCPWYPAS